MDTCQNCLKPQNLCVCAEIRELPTRTSVLILQHPQEPDRELGTARIANLALPNSTLKVGLSWPNLKAALGPQAQPSRWAVLYLGSGFKGPKTTQTALQLVSKKGAPLPESDEVLKTLEGIIVLDGTWSQAKALWWRNAWLLKLRRAILIPKRPSLYKNLRKEPRRECVSTLESIGLALTAMGEPAEVEAGLLDIFEKLLTKAREKK